MSTARSVGRPTNDRPVEVSSRTAASRPHGPTQAENLAVSSRPRSGASSAASENAADGDSARRSLPEALGSYLNEDLVRSIGDARTRLGRYVLDEDAEVLVETIPYREYAGTKS